MPIEIRELVIRATVEQSENDSESQPSTQSNRGDQANNALNDRMEELKKIIQDKNER